MGILTGFEHIVRENEPLAPYTWFRIGGPAEYLAEPTSEAELAALVRRCREVQIPIRIIGGGSNLLVRDQGVSGIVIHLAAAIFSEIKVRGNCVDAGGGAQLSHLISTTVREGLAGLEYLVGVPGTVGGAVHGNTGTENHDIGQWTTHATVMNRSGEIVCHSPDDMQFAYRYSSLDELVILRAEFTLNPEDRLELTKRMQTLWIVKKSKQPSAGENIGRIFRNAGGLRAADLIEQAGLRGAKVGGAEISDRHANFIAVRPGATSEHVVRLIELMQMQVQDRIGVELETEIEIW